MWKQCCAATGGGEGLGAALAGCRQQLLDIAKADNKTVMEVGKQVAEMQKLLDEFSAFAHGMCTEKVGPLKHTLAEWNAAWAALGKLMELVGELSRSREALRNKIMSRSLSEH